MTARRDRLAPASALHVQPGCAAPAAPRAPGAADALVAWLRRQRYDLAEHAGDPYARGWTAAIEHVMRRLGGTP